MNPVAVWNDHINLMKGLNCSKNDRLDVVAGQLIHKKGDHARSKGIMVTSNPTALAEYLEQCIDQTARPYFEQLKQNPSYEEITLFRKQIKILRTKISDLEYIFRANDLNQKENAKRFSDLFEKASALYDETVKEKSELDRPPLRERPIVPYVYQEADRIKWHHPKRVPVQDTITAAKRALELSSKESLPKKIARVALLAIPLMVTSWIHLFKKILWNPIEKHIYGGLKTESPFDKLIRVAFPDNPHLDQFWRLAGQLWHMPVITPEAVDAVCEFAPDFTDMDLFELSVVEEDVTAYAPYIRIEKPGVTVEEYLNLLKRVCESQQIHRVSLKVVQNLIKVYQKVPRDESLEAFLIRDAQRFSIENENKYYFVDAPNDANRHISLEGMNKILKAMVASPAFKTMILHKSFSKLPEVNQLMMDQGFKVKPTHRFESVMWVR